MLEKNEQIPETQRFQKVKLLGLDKGGKGILLGRLLLINPFRVEKNDQSQIGIVLKL